MKHHTIVGGGGTRLHVVETGNPRGQAVLFIHGFSQCWLAWEQQLSSDLAQDHRLIAMDLRGHGASDKPADGYRDSRLWADDVDACIRELELGQPLLCGWSYGPLVMLDYVRYYGEERIAGMHFVGAMTKLGSDAALAVLSPEVLALVPGFFARDAEQSVRSLEALIRMCFVHELPAPHLYTMLGYNASVPPFVRQAMFSRVLDNDDVLRTIRKPVLITQGADDAVVKIAAVEQHRAGVGHAQVHVVAGAGHAVFWEDAPAFNKRLAEFLREVATRDSVVGGTSFARADQ